MFGCVIVGLDVVEAIGAEPVGSRIALVSGVSQILTDVPVDKITITTTARFGEPASAQPQASRSSATNEPTLSDATLG